MKTLIKELIKKEGKIQVEHLYAIATKDKYFVESSVNVWISKEKGLVFSYKINEHKIRFDLKLNLAGAAAHLRVTPRNYLARYEFEKILPRLDLPKTQRDSSILLGTWPLHYDAAELLRLTKQHIMNFLDAIRLNEIKVTRTRREVAIAAGHKRAIRRIRSEIQATGRRLRIGFLVNDNTKWNGDYLLKELRRQDDVECSIYLINNSNDRTHAQRAAANIKEYEFFSRIDGELINLYNPRTDKITRIERQAVDILFCQQPWGMQDIPERMNGLALTVNMHYGYAVYANDGMQYRQKDFHPFIWRFFAQGPLHRELHIKSDPRAESRVVVTGYPKLDAYFDSDISLDSSIWPIPEAAKRVIYAPHHSFGKNTMRISTFGWNHDLLFDLARCHPGIAWAYKPHGRLRYVVEREGIMTQTKYAEYEQAWEDLANGKVFLKGQYFNLFRTSTCMITDCSSFLGEYVPTGKPLIWLVARDPAVQLNPIGQDLSRSFYKAHTREEIKELFEKVVIRGEDPLKPIRDEVIERHFNTARGASQQIVDILRGVCI